MALTTRDYEFLARLIRNAAQWDRFENREGNRTTCKTLRRYMGEKVLNHAQSQNPNFNVDKFRELANLPIE